MFPQGIQRTGHPLQNILYVELWGHECNSMKFQKDKSSGGKLSKFTAFLSNVFLSNGDISSDLSPKKNTELPPGTCMAITVTSIQVSAL